MRLIVASTLLAVGVGVAQGGAWKLDRINFVNAALSDEWMGQSEIVRHDRSRQVPVDLDQDALRPSAHA